MTPSQRKARQGVLKVFDITRNVAAYCPNGKLLRHPEVSALYTDLHGLPPALFTVGTLDAFLDDSAPEIARRFAIWPGTDHAFTETPHPLAAAANARIDASLNECLK